MKPSPEAPPAFRFGTFEVDPRTGELHNQGARVRLQDQPFRLLVRLLSSAGEVVTREELRAELWPTDTFVDFENGLNTAVNKVREALGDAAASPRYVETVPRHGYRFIHPLEPGPFPSAQPERAGSRRARRLAAGVGATVALTLALVALDVGGLRTRLLGRRPHVRSIAVLPLENLSGDPEQEYFADGMTEALISQLAQAGSLRVISRTSVQQFKRTRKPIPQVARELKVDAVVEGTVTRSGSRVRISVQLVDGATDRHLWAGVHEGDLRDVLSLQQETALAIAKGIGLEVSPEERGRLAAAGAVDPEAHEAYLRGRYLVNQFNPAALKKALAYFHEATERAPAYAPAHAALGHTYFLYAQPFAGTIDLDPRVALELSKAAASRAVALDGALAEGHAVLGLGRWLHDRDWSGAEQEFRQAIRLNANSADAHNYFAIFLSASGRHPEASAELAAAIDLDPLNLRLRTLRAELLCYAGEYDAAIRHANDVLALDPPFPRPHLVLAWAYEQKREPARAVAEYVRFMTGMGLPDEAAAALRQAFADAGISGFYRQWLRMTEETRQRRYVPPTQFARIHAALGDKEAAFRSLEQALTERDSDLMFLGVMVPVRSLRADPRFADLLRRIGHPALAR